MSAWLVVLDPFWLRPLTPLVSMVKVRRVGVWTCRFPSAQSLVTRNQPTPGPPLHMLCRSSSDWLSSWPTAIRVSVYNKPECWTTNSKRKSTLTLVVVPWTERTFDKNEDWAFGKMCRGLAALPQTCLERWDMPEFSLVLLLCLRLFWHASFIY